MQGWSDVMSTLLIDIIVGFVIFVLGIAVALRRFAKQDYVVLTVCATLTPLLAVIAVFYVLYSAIIRKSTLDPCPAGLEEAERIVEARRQKLYGGPPHKLSIARDWRRAYAIELQRESDQVQRVARRYLIPA
jgi:hypothetical protein